ncbi:hypothetical protein M9H77_11338 [Catharanthus roseus]|uniref:Uncharacterized protein n=1 Tax=Catharanthus roseus TaxID=4058 RepID=A0ACC0BEC1_CATRO|nr:hypothetical protein M9H77_11338 [Catharanthus roseus]
MACNIHYILWENPDFYNPFPSEILCPVFYPVHCSCLEDEVLNYKEHLSKSPHARLDKNSIGTLQLGPNFNHINAIFYIQPHLLSNDIHRIALSGARGSSFTGRSN